MSGATFRTLLPRLADHVTCHVIDLPGAGSSRFTAETTLTVDQHIESVRRVLDILELDEVAVVGHDSGGLIARHTVAGDPRVRAMGLLDTEQPKGLSLRFRMFLSGRHVPGYGRALAWLAGTRRIRRVGLALGDAFADASLLDGEFDEFFLKPIHDDADRRDAAIRLLRSFDRATRARSPRGASSNHGPRAAGVGPARRLLPGRVGARDGPLLPRCTTGGNRGRGSLRTRSDPTRSPRRSSRSSSQRRPDMAP